MTASYQEFYCNAATGDNAAGGSDEGSPSFSDTAGSWDGTSVYTTSVSTANVSVGQFANVGGSYIARVASKTAGTITLDTFIVSGTAPTSGVRTLKVGGAWKGPNGADGWPISNFRPQQLGQGTGPPAVYPRINFKNNAAYNITAAITTSAGNSSLGTWQGYASTPSDGGKAIFDGGTSGASYVLLTVGNSYGLWADLIFRNNGATGSAAGVQAKGTGNIFLRCVFHDFQGQGVLTQGATTPNVFAECEAYNCNLSNTASFAAFHLNQTTNTLGAQYVRCVAHDNTTANTSGFWSDDSCILPFYQGCIADTNGADGFHLENSGPPVTMTNCIAYNNGGHGINLNTNNAIYYIENCILAGNGTAGAGYGINVANTNVQMITNNCAFFSNQSGQVTPLSSSAGLAFPTTFNTITLTADPFNDAANGDFGLNNTAGGGALCRNAGRGSFTQTGIYTKTTQEFPDVGLQHNDPGALVVGQLVAKI